MSFFESIFRRDEETFAKFVLGNFVKFFVSTSQGHAYVVCFLHQILNKPIFYCVIFEDLYLFAHL